MDVAVRAFAASQDVFASLRQMEDAFGANLARFAAKHPPFANIGVLSINPSTWHPAFNVPRKMRRSFHKSTNTYFADAEIDYLRWVSPSWADRVDAYAEALSVAVGRVAKSRLSSVESSLLQDLIAQTRSTLRDAPPSRIEPVAPIYVHLDASSNVISVGAKSFASAPGTLVVEVAPEDAGSFAEKPAIARPSRTPMFKLYRKDDQSLLYYEAWPREQVIVEHWGVYGERGETREHPFGDAQEAAQIVERLKKAARLKGFRPAPPSRAATLVIEYPIDGFGDRADLARRHALEDHFNEIAGWLGLGHCDGGSTGSDTMEVFLIVTDYERAKRAIEREAAGSNVSGYSRIYRMK